MSRTGAHALLETLRAAGVDAAFGLPGVHNLPLWDAVRASGLRLVSVRHEQTAGYAADAYARTSGRLGVALSTSGPGAANLAAATGEAWSASSPVLHISTQIATGLRSPRFRGVLHECAGQADMFAPITRDRAVADTADDIPGLAARLVGSALAANAGPVYLEVPTDLLSARTDAPPAALVPSSPTVSPPDLDQLAARLLTASAPAIWLGGGAVRAGAAPAALALAETLGAPVFTTFMSRGAVPDSHPLAVGLTIHEPSVAELLARSDVVLVLGSDLDGMTTQHWKIPFPPILRVDADPGQLDCGYAAAAGAVADARLAAEGLLAAAERAVAEPADGAARVAAARATATAKLEADERDAPAWELMRTIGDATPAGVPVCADMAVAGYWAAAYLRREAPRRLLYPMGWGTLGFGLPAAIGAAVGAAAPALAIVGDGGILYAIGELSTIAAEGLPVVTLVVADDGYGMLRFGQEQAGEAAFGVDFPTPDFVAIARAFGVEAEEVPDVKALGAALESAFEAGLPRLLILRARLHPPRSTTARWFTRHGPGA